MMQKNRKHFYLKKDIKGWKALKPLYEDNTTGYNNHDTLFPVENKTLKKIGETKKYLQVRKITNAMNKKFLKLYWTDKENGAEIEFIVPDDHPDLSLRVRSHEWFQGFDWELLDSGKYPAPWLPVSVGCRAALRGTSKYPKLENATIIIDKISLVQKKVKSKDGKKDVEVEMADCHIENNPKEKYQIDVANLTTIYTPWKQKSENKYLKNARTGKWEMQNPLEMYALLH